MTITEEQFRKAKLGDKIMDARGDIIPITAVLGGEFSTIIVDHPIIDKLHFFEGRIVDQNFAEDVDINHPHAELLNDEAYQKMKDYVESEEREIAGEIFAPFSRFFVGTADKKIECVVLPIVKPIDVLPMDGTNPIFQGNFMGQFEEIDYHPVPLERLKDYNPEKCRIMRIPHLISRKYFCFDMSVRKPELLLNKECLVYVALKDHRIGFIRRVSLTGRKNLFCVANCGDDKAPFLFSSKKPSPIIGELVCELGEDVFKVS